MHFGFHIGIISRDDPFCASCMEDKLGNWSKSTILKQDPLLGWEGGSQRHHLSSNITNNILLAFKFESTQECSASKSRHY